MSPRKTQWTGADLPPLPFESLANVTERFAWLNAMPWNLMRSCFTPSGRERRLDIRLFASESYGQLILDVYDEEKNPVSEIWRTSSFRFCPICLQDIYHTKLFQCLQLQQCPLHEVPLCTICQTCGMPAPRLSLNACLFDRPYECDYCHLPIAGAPPDLNGHLRLREDAASLLRQRLAPYFQWWTSGANERRQIEAMLGRRSERYQYRWGRVEELLSSLVEPSIESLRDITTAANAWPSATRIRWRYQIALGNSEAGHLHRFGQPHTSNEVTMYGHALRVILKRVAIKLSEKELDIVSLLERFDEIGSKRMPVELLALGLMRLQIEKRCLIQDGRMLLPFYSVRPTEGNFHTVEAFGKTTPRVAWYAAYMSLYSAWYHLARREGREACWKLFREKPIPHSMVLLRSWVWSRRGREWSRGYIEDAEEAWFDGDAAAMALSEVPLFPYRAATRVRSPEPWYLPNTED